MQPKPDDFLFDRDGPNVEVTFAPTGARYRLAITSSGAVERIEELSPVRDGSDAYEEADVRDMARRLVGAMASAKA